MRADVKINDLWMFSMGWLREEIDFPTPQSQTNTVVVPGRNAPIRFTEALGRVSYQPRSFSITLSMLGSREKFNQMKDQLTSWAASLRTRLPIALTPSSSAARPVSPRH